jgi:hypothetical protein
MDSWKADMDSSNQQATERAAEQHALDATTCNVQQLLLSVARLARPEAQQQQQQQGGAAAAAAAAADCKKQRTG